MAKKRKLTPRVEPQQQETAASDAEVTPQPPPPIVPAEELQVEAELSPIDEDPKPETLDTPEPAPTDAAADIDLDLSTPNPSTAADNDVADATDNNAAEATDSDAAAEGADDEADESDPASVQKLLEPFSKEQLLELLLDAAVQHPDILSEIRRVADADPAHRKIFVHGLGWDTDTEALAAAYRGYGEIEDCKAVIDKATGKSKGYGFVLFKHRDGASRALQEPQKKIGSRLTSCQLASAGPGQVAVAVAAPPASEYTQRKIFVSNVGADLDPKKLLEFFSQFGEVEEGPMGLDKVTGKPRGFCLFVYKTIVSAKKALEEPHKNFDGHMLHCQRAIDGPKQNKPGFNFQTVGSYNPGLQQVQGGIGASRNGSSGFPMGNNTPQQITGHLMAPPATGMGFNQAAQPAAGAGLNPVLGQALTALLASQGAGLGLTNLLGGAIGNQAVPGQLGNNVGHGMQGGYVNQPPAGNLNPGVMGVMGGYGAPTIGQGGYGNAQMGQRRNQRGEGRMGGGAPYMGR